MLAVLPPRPSRASSTASPTSTQQWTQRLPRHRVGVGQSGLVARSRPRAVHDPGALLRHDRAARPPHRPRARRARGARPGGRHAGRLHRRPRRLHGRPPDDAEGADPLRGADPRAADRARAGVRGGGGGRRPRRHHRHRADGVRACGLPMPAHLRGTAAPRRAAASGSSPRTTCCAAASRSARSPRGAIGSPATRSILEAASSTTWPTIRASSSNRWDDPALRAVRGDLLALLDDVMRHDLGRELPLVCQAG